MDVGAGKPAGLFAPGLSAVLLCYESRRDARRHFTVRSATMSDRDEFETAGPDGPSLTIRDAQRAVDAWIGQFDQGYWPPLSNLARLVEEVGELARELNHRHGHKRKRPDEPEQDLALELGDILFVLIALANEQGIDLEDAFARVIAKYKIRDASRWT